MSDKPQRLTAELAAHTWERLTARQRDLVGKDGYSFAQRMRRVRRFCPSLTEDEVYAIAAYVTEAHAASAWSVGE